MYSELMEKYLPQDDIFLFNTGKAEKAWLLLGCRYIEEIKMHRFVVWAPNARAVSLVGDFNAWDSAVTPMQRHGGMWVCFMPGLKTAIFTNTALPVRTADACLNPIPLLNGRSRG